MNDRTISKKERYFLIAASTVIFYALKEKDSGQVNIDSINAYDELYDKMLEGLTKDQI